MTTIGLARKHQKTQSILWNKRVVSVFLWSLFSSLTFAQGVGSNAEIAREGEVIKGDTKIVDIREVERGVYVSSEYGLGFFLPSNAAHVNATGKELTTRFGLRVGYDILNNVNVDLWSAFFFTKGELDPSLISQAGAVVGDVQSWALGLSGRFAFVTTQRFFVFAHLGAGYALWFPKEITGSQGSFMLEGNVGFEYYTKLRHLSVGLHAGVDVLFAPQAFGIHLYPTLKYTF